MSSPHQQLMCPSCKNRYPLDRFKDCPACGRQLVIPQPNNISQKNSNSGRIDNRSGNTIIGNDNKVYSHLPKSDDIATYQQATKTKINQFKPVVPTVSWSVLSLLFIILDRIGSFASIISWVDQDNIIINQIINILEYLIRSRIFLGAGIFFVIPALFSLRDFLEFRQGKTIRFFGKFAKKENGIAYSFLLRCPCPVQGCSGILTVTKAPKNEEGVPYIGRCNKKRKLHTYNFDFENWKGERVMLTTPVNKNSSQ